MPLDISRLSAAGCDSSNNPILQELWQSVKWYNENYTAPATRTPQQAGQLICALDAIYVCCARYMTGKFYKEEKGKDASQVAKRKLRYEAFEHLINNLVREMDASGGRFLAGPANFRQISDADRSYWLERVDPNSRAGYDLSNCYPRWQASKSTKTFWEWLEEDTKTNPIYTQVNGYNNANGAQWEHCVYFDQGVLRYAQNDGLFDTRGLKTEFAGKGWGVFVCSTPIVDGDGNFGWFAFSYTHKAGFDHHSSFIGGQPVLAAGEWIVDPSGVIQVITAKSGHYTPQWQNLQNFVKQFPEVPAEAIIRPNLLDIRDPDRKVNFYTVQDFRLKALQATPLQKSAVLSKVQSANPNVDAVKNKGWMDKL